MAEKGKEDKGGFQSYMRYSGIGFQIAGALGLGVFIGYELDKWLHTAKPYFMLLFGLAFLFVGMFFAFRDLMRGK